ncbi:hypothetical protein [Pseudonocardia sp. TRM90224]|uniref:hypothetical protein n=1 Tax=Pseudonocardia sp. TRM90224 TaxID=2812678 RepID=UPI001E5B0559|nr:hypothetical protein [Pseudonocardia sp. TRM90224]
MTTSRSTRFDLRVLLRGDAVFECVLAAGCLWLAIGLPAAGAWASPPWLGRPALLVVAVVLLAAAGALWWLSSRNDPAAARVVAVANAVTATLIAVWAVLGGGAGGSLRVSLAVVAVLLAGLAAAQWHRSHLHRSAT